MAKAVFFSIPAYGHTNPTLPLVRELVRQSEEVIYYSSPEFKDRVLESGAQYREYVINQDDHFVQMAGKDMALLYYFMVRTTQNILEKLVREVQQIGPDYILHDAICPWGRYVASICGLPAVTSISTFALNPRVVDLKKTINFFRSSLFRSIRYILAARRIQKELFQKYGIPPRGFVQTMINEEDLNIVYTSSLMQPKAGSFDQDKYKFVGPSITKRENDPDQTDYSKLTHPLIYVSMGTIWKDSFRIEDLVNALQDFGGSLVISGTDKRHQFDHNEKVIIKSHINQLEVLKYCDVFVTHAGMNSVNEALFWGVPMCLHPFQIEQEIVTDRVLELHCGLRINTFTQAKIYKTVKKVLEDQSYRENCLLISRSFKEAGGYQRAVEYILAYTGKRIG